MKDKVLADIDSQETEEWLEAFDDILDKHGRERGAFLLHELHQRSKIRGVRFPFSLNTPYINTIPREEEPEYPGDRKIERRIKSLVRWNAMAMVVRANKRFPGIGGHISTYASAATLYQIGFNHFFRGKDHKGGGDQIYFQGHASPGIYARAFLEYRLQGHDLHNFRGELREGGGLPSYPHPRLMPDFWEFPTVSMGLSAITGIYQARFNKYLQNRKIKDTSEQNVWVFLGDGETDEPESLGALTLASREELDNLIFVINCNLQRLDGPVRGNGKIIQELETVFRGAGWNVIKVIWGGDWDALLEKDTNGLLQNRMESAVDGDYQKYSVEPGSYIRKEFFGTDPELLKMVEHLSDEELWKLRRGGHDPAKVYAAYKSAYENEGSPTVVLAKSIKGYGLGEAGEGRNVTHQQKKLNEEELKSFRDRFDIPITDEELLETPFYRPEKGSVEYEYLMDRRSKLGGAVPRRVDSKVKLVAPSLDDYKEFLSGTEREVSTTMVFMKMFAQLLSDKQIGKNIVPIVPDEARTFGMESLFRKVGIYSSVGQVYKPVDSEMLLYYREEKEGQILEEGITEAGSMSSFIAAGTSRFSHGVPMIPFYIYYSMFGYQRIGDLAWAFSDMMGNGFLIGGTAGRTTLAGEGLQHQDGQSHSYAQTIPNVKAYDPAFAYEIAVIVLRGIKEMYGDLEDSFYYITLGNENYSMPSMPDGAESGICKGIYKLREAETGEAAAQLFGSGAILNEALKAQEILSEKYGIPVNVWSVTSYSEVYRDAVETERWNILHPEEPRIPYVSELLQNEKGPVIAASDYLKSLSNSLGPWIKNGITSLGTDGWGRSDTRDKLREYFEVNAEFIAYTVLSRLALTGDYDKEALRKASKELISDKDKPDPTKMGKSRT